MILSEDAFQGLKRACKKALNETMEAGPKQFIKTWLGHEKKDSRWLKDKWNKGIQFADLMMLNSVSAIADTLLREPASYFSFIFIIYWFVFRKTKRFSKHHFIKIDSQNYRRTFKSS